MADKCALVPLPEQGSLSVALSSTRSHLIERGQRDIASLIERQSETRLIAAVRDGYTWFLIDETGKSVGNPAYGAVLPFSCGRAAFSISNLSECLWPARSESRTGRFNKHLLFGDGYGFLDDQELAEIAHDACLSGYGDRFSGGLWGYLDLNGEVAISPRFEKVRAFSEGLAGVAFRGKWGFIDNNGSFVIEPRLAAVRDFRDGLAIAKVSDKCGFIDRTGQFVIEPLFDYVWEFSEDLACVEINDKYGFIDKSGKFIITPQFGNARDFHGGVAQVSMSRKEFGGKRHYIDKTGEPLVNSSSIRSILDFSEGLGVVMVGTGEYDWEKAKIVYRYGKDSKDVKEIIERPRERHAYGYIDNTGRIRIEAHFDSAESFKNEYARVKFGGKWRLIDKVGGFAQPAYAFHEGLAPIKVDELYGFIDMHGKIVIEPQFESVGNFKNGFARVGQRQTIEDSVCLYFKYGFIDKAGNVRIPIKFHTARNLECVSR